MPKPFDNATIRNIRPVLGSLPYADLVDADGKVILSGPIAYLAGHIRGVYASTLNVFGEPVNKE